MTAPGDNVMSATPAETTALETMTRSSGGKALLLRVGLVLSPFVLLVALKPILPAWAAIWPSEWAVPFIDWINAVVAVLKDYAASAFLPSRTSRGPSPAPWNGRSIFHKHCWSRAFAASGCRRFPGS